MVRFLAHAVGGYVRSDAYQIANGGLSAMEKRKRKCLAEQEAARGAETGAFKAFRREQLLCSPIRPSASAAVSAQLHAEWETALSAKGVKTRPLSKARYEAMAQPPPARAQSPEAACSSAGTEAATR